MRPLLRLTAWCAAALWLTACGGGDSLDRIERDGKLRMMTRNGPDTYYVDKGEPAGFEYQLATRFADHLGVELEVVPEHSVMDILQGMRRDQADFAAAALSITASREREFAFGLPYDEIRPEVLYLSGQRRPRKLTDLIGGRLVVSRGSSHADTLAFLKELEPALSWEEIDNAQPSELLEMVAKSEADYTIIDSNAFLTNRSIWPRVRRGFTIDRSDQLAWLFKRGPRHDRLREAANQFIAQMQESGELEHMQDQLFGHAWGIDQVNSQTFNRNVERRLPRFEPLVRQVADEYQMDWHLLAAIAYQESHWNPKARSPTGVRGMMMLTQCTAREMGVDNRLDPLQSLRGGARYYRKLKRRLPEDIHEPDRTWFALAAYNIGRGHLEDARVITERKGGDPHLWDDVAEHLPLLQKQQYYSKTRFGYARGSEPVTYVKNIRHYFSILSWRDAREASPPPPVDTREFLHQSLSGSKLSAL